MNNEEELMRNGDSSPLHKPHGKGEENEDDDNGNSSTSDDDSSSSSSGSSSSSDSSDSDSDGDDDDNANKDDEIAHNESGGGDTLNSYADRKYSIESSHSASGLGGGSNRASNAANASAEPLNVNSNRAAARFREQNSSVGLMALGTKKRDRRTIEEIQRDLQRRKVGKSGSSASSNGVSLATNKKLQGAGSSSGTLAARASPPKGSPVLSPETGANDTPPIALSGFNPRLSKGKATSVRDRLAMKVLGRGRSNSATAPKPKKGASSGASSGSTGMVTNISAGKVIKTGPIATHLDSSSGETRTETSVSTKMEPKIEPKIIDLKPDGKIVRALLRGMLRYGDLTDVNMFPGDRKWFADEYKLPNFIIRSNLHNSTKTSEQQLLKMAVEIVDRAQKAIEDKQDNMKYADVEIKPSQVIERLYENLKLRIAVQRAMRDANCPKNGTNGAYVLIAKQCDLPVLGIPRDFPAWTWAEKEHDWNSKKDASLLIGIYVHGFGGWEDILNDDLLHFQQQRALKGERMKKRAENLLKRLPPPDETGEPKIVNSVNALVSSSQNSNQSLGAQFSAIINNGAPMKGGRMQRAAERARAARQTGADVKTVIPEDSIRRSHTASMTERQQKQPVSSPATTTSVATPYDDGEPEDGEIGEKPFSTAGSVSPVHSSSSSKSRSKRPGSDDLGRQNESPRKKSKRDRDTVDSERRKLSEEECLEKWKPNKKLKEIRQVLKKMKIMASWSKSQKDEVVVEKVFKYVTTIGEAIDRIVIQAEQESGNKMYTHEWDELCTCLWTYAASFTPFSSVIFEQLYEDICADGETLQQEDQRTKLMTAA